MAASENNQTERISPQAGASPNGAGGGSPVSGKPDDEQKSKPKPAVLVVVVVLIVAAVVLGFRYFQYSQTHAQTDDAYVTGDLINVSPVVPGTLAHLEVDEGDVVKKGQIVARLDDSGPRAAYLQALAQWKAAESQIPQAQTNLAFTAETTLDQIRQAEAALAAQNAKVDQEGRRTEMTAQQASSQLAQAQAQAAAALQQVQTARAQHSTALAAVRTAQAAAAAAHQQVAAAQANATRAHRDAVRYASLYGSNGAVGAVTAQQYDAAVAADQTAAAQLGAAQDQARQAQEAVAQAQANADAAKAAVAAAKSQAAAAQSATQVARAGLLQVPVQKGAYVSSQHTATQSVAALGLAQAGQQQVKLREQMIDTFHAQAYAAQQAAAQAKVQLDDTVIAAPSDGIVVKKGANVGDAIQPGQTLFTMTRGQRVWVSANFKETQVEHMRPGQPVDIDVDAFPGTVYRGKVSSINEASGNATALLPADNATGNFTKVVQRIPVKILLDPQPKGNAEHLATQEDIERLRQGMSVTASVDTSSH
ncbi:MAG: HlyD family secretion protein [Capsulimonadaceae bacterium]|nr:HlyD family secretion protein [Capsulimonadaceae bacterium]